MKKGVYESTLNFAASSTVHLVWSGIDEEVAVFTGSRLSYIETSGWCQTVVGGACLFLFHFDKAEQFGLWVCYVPGWGNLLLSHWQALSTEHWNLDRTQAPLDHPVVFNPGV